MTVTLFSPWAESQSLQWWTALAFLSQSSFKKIHTGKQSKTPESPLDHKEISPVNPKGDQRCIVTGRTDAEAPNLWPPDAKSWLWKRPWCWERLKAEGEGEDRGWDGCFASLTQWTCVWANSGRWWRTGKPDVLQSTGLQRIGRDLATEQQNNANVPNVEQDGNLTLPNCAQVYLANLIIQKSTPSTHLAWSRYNHNPCFPEVIILCQQIEESLLSPEKQFPGCENDWINYFRNYCPSPHTTGFSAHAPSPLRLTIHLSYLFPHYISTHMGEHCFYIPQSFTC